MLRNSGSHFGLKKDEHSVNKNLIKQLLNYNLIVELNSFREDLMIENANFISRFQSIFDVRLIQDNILNTNNLDDFNILLNNGRAKIMSESRFGQMICLITAPKV